jgi:hypothetical protein
MLMLTWNTIDADMPVGTIVGQFQCYDENGVVQPATFYLDDVSVPFTIDGNGQLLISLSPLPAGFGSITVYGVAQTGAFAGVAIDDGEFIIQVSGSPAEDVTSLTFTSP